MRRQELIDAIEGVFKSYEFYCYVTCPKEEYPDEYDYMMAPKWAALKKEYDLLKEGK